MGDVVRLPVLPAPRVRSDCLPGGWNSRRPCVHSSCFYHSSSLGTRYSTARPYGLCVLDLAEEPKTLEEVGEVCGLTREAIRQLQDKALAKLARRGVTSRELQALREHEFQHAEHALAGAEET